MRPVDLAMNSESNKVVVVLDPNYGSRLSTFAGVAPVWVVATAVNKAFCQETWKAQPNRDHRENGALTSFNVENPDDRAANLLNILPTIEEHHGEIRDGSFCLSAGFVLEVVGLPPSRPVTDSLREYGLASATETSEGFQMICSRERP